MTVRGDGRHSNFELRPITCEYDYVSNADASCRFFQGCSGVIASICLPKENSTLYSSFSSRNKASLRTFSAALDVLVRPVVGAPTAKEKYFESVLLKYAQSVIITESYQKSIIRIVIQILNDDGGLTAVMTNAVMLIAIDAGILLRRTTFSVCIGIQDGLVRKKVDSAQGSTGSASSESPQNENADKSCLLLDPTALEKEGCASCVNLSTCVNTGKCTSVHSEAGDVTLTSDYTRRNLFTLALAASHEVSKYAKQAWMEKMQSIYTLFNVNNRFSVEI